MKHLLIVLVLLVFISPSCKKSGAVSYKSTGTIIGLRPPVQGFECSGRYVIKINDSTAHPTFDALPAGSGIDLATATFPINVKLNWHNEPGCFLVVIDAIEKE